MNVLQFIIDIVAKGEQTVIGKVHAVQRSLSEAEAAADSFARKTSSGLRQAFMSLPGAQFFSNPLVALTTGVGVVSKLGMEADKTATAFRVLVGNEETAGMLLRQLNDYADKTLWDRPEIVEAAKTMLGFGVSTRTVYKDLKMLGDVAMGDKNKLKSLALVFGQISSAGKLTGNDLLQMINAGYNPLLDIAELTGKSVATLKDEMSKGLISIKLVRQALEKATGPGGKFNGMVDTMAKTTAGAWEQLKGKFTAGLLRVYRVIQPMLIPAMEAMGKIMEWLFATIEKTVNFLVKYKDWIVPVITAVVTYKTAVKALTRGLKTWKVMQKGLNAILKVNPILAIVSALAALLVKLKLSDDRFLTFGEKIEYIGDQLERVWNISKNLLTLDVVGMWNWFRYGNEEGQVVTFEDKKAIQKIIRDNKLEDFNTFRYKGETLKVGDLYRAIPGFREFVWGDQNTKKLANPFVGGNTMMTTSWQSPIAKQFLGGGDATDPSDMAAAAGDETTDGIANDITTGGTRNTQITLTIGKFWEDVNVYQSEKADDKIYDAVVESVNRALEIALSAAR